MVCGYVNDIDDVLRAERYFLADAQIDALTRLERRRLVVQDANIQISDALGDDHPHAAHRSTSSFPSSSLDSMSKIVERPYRVAGYDAPQLAGPKTCRGVLFGIARRSEASRSPFERWKPHRFRLILLIQLNGCASEGQSRPSLSRQARAGAGRLVPDQYTSSCVPIVSSRIAGLPPCFVKEKTTRRS